MSDPVAPGLKSNTLRRPAIEFFAHLLHFQKAGSVNLVLDRRGCNPGFWTLSSVVDTSKSPLQGFLDEALGRHKDFRTLRIGLADLTKDVNKPELVGHSLLKQGSIASTCKISAMYASFQLKLDLEEFASTFGAKDKKELFEAARSNWALTQIDNTSAPVTPLNEGSPKLELQGELVKKNGKKIKLVFAEPQLDQIFKVTPSSSGGLQIDFRDDYTADLELMIPHSNNQAAHRCISKLGFLFINSALWQCDLFNAHRNGGLWLGGSYGGTAWGAAPVGGSDAKQAGTPAAVIALFTLVIQKQLVSETASQSMMDLLSIGAGLHPGGYGSFMVNALAKAGRRPSVALSKVGIATANHDCIAVSRSQGGTQLRYVAVAMDVPLGKEKMFEPLAQELDNCIMRNNGLTP
jgi:hypothetical protein